LIRNNQNRRRRGGNSGPRPQQMGGGGNYGSRLDNRQRGNASQLLEKYRALARDAQQAGDRVTAEYYLQYADHYYRVLGDYRDKQPDNRQRRDSYEDDSAGYAAADDSDADDDEDGDDRDDSRDDGRAEARDDNRGNWRDERPNRDRNARDAGGRDNSQRDGGQREGSQRDGGQREQSREPRRDGERQPWKSNRDAGEQGRGEQSRNDQGRGDQYRNEQNRNEQGRGEPRAERDGNRDNNRGEGRRERRIESPRNDAPRAAEPVLNDEGPIPGLPGPATLRATRNDASPVPRPERRTLRRDAPLAAELAPVAETVPPAPVEPAFELAEAPAPRRRGRPRKVVDETVADS
jgi:hypothetical protein